MFDYTTHKSSLSFNNKFYDENIFSLFDECSEIFSNDEKKMFFIDCINLFKEFSDKCNKKYLEIISDSRWEDKIQSLVNYRLDFTPLKEKKKNIIHQLLKRQCNNNCNLNMQAEFYIPNYMLYKQMKDPYFKYCCENNLMYSDSIKNIAKLYESINEDMKKLYISLIEKIKYELLGVIRHKSYLIKVFNNLLMSTDSILFRTEIIDEIYNFLLAWRDNHISDERILWSIISTTMRPVLRFGPRKVRTIDRIEYEALYPKWINLVKDFELKQKYMFAHIMTIDIQLYIRRIQVEKENFALFLKRFLFYYKSILPEKYFNIEQESEKTSELTSKLQSAHLT